MTLDAYRHAMCCQYCGEPYYEDTHIDLDGSCDECGAEMVYPFDDVTDCRVWYYNAVEWSRATGLFLGDENGNFNPTASATRAETAQVFARMQLDSGI